MQKTKEVVVEGCLVKGVEPGCILLQTKGHPIKLYSLHGPSVPPLGRGLGVQVKGKPGGVSQCLQGEPLQVESWIWTKFKCPE